MANNATLDSAIPSRLLTNTESVRNNIITRNLYNPDREYPLPKDAVSRTVDSLNAITNAVLPFRGADLSNTVLGRLVNDESTPLAKIGLVLLGKQLAMNASSHVAQQVLPTINVSNLFDGDKSTKLFTKNIDYRITSRPMSTFARIIDSLTSSISPNQDNPFIGNTTNSNFISNTGEAQLNSLITNLNRNFYKETSNYTLVSTADKIKNSIQRRQVKINNWNGKRRIFYNFIDYNFNPYIQFVPSLDGENIANDSMRLSNDTDTDNTQEYAPDADYIKNNFGTTNLDYINDAGKLLLPNDTNAWIDTNNEINADFPGNNIIWGINGISESADKKIHSLRGDLTNLSRTDNLNSLFNVKSGLLEYTRNLLNATDGNMVDITRKAFVRGDKIAGFNGSALWQSPDTSLIGRRTGVRQHSVADQYDNFAKTIRFNGNSVYKGNENSVVNKSVIPKMHPVFDKIKKEIDTKNMMLSIENLAIKVIKSESSGTGIIDDEFGTQIPLSEVGPFNGRIMWFPPYNMEINESSVAKYDQTMMVGRSEPIYSYMSSERSATLNFTLLVDYPEQLKYYQGTDKNKQIAEFFAFGTTTASDASVIANIDAQIQKLENENNIIQGTTSQEEPNITKPNDIKVSFPNDLPSEGTGIDGVEQIVQHMFWDLMYEYGRTNPPAGDTDFGMNKTVYNTVRIPVTQYSVINPAIPLNKALFDLYDNEDFRPLFKIKIVGKASKLYIENGNKERVYNKELGQRRADAIAYLIKRRLVKKYKNSDDVNLFNSLGIPAIETSSEGSENASKSGSTTSGIYLQSTKNDRVAIVSFERTSAPYVNKKTDLTAEEQAIVDENNKKIEELKSQRDLAKKRTNDIIYNERTTNDTASLTGFKSVSGNYFYPVFHSQTPEDFHKRLTFLQQCTRQGASKRYDLKDENGIMRARNSVFGRQPICILRVGDFFYTKVIIENVNIDYTETTWDMNPEGFGMQPMLAKVTLQMKVLGGQSLKGPIDALQNAVSFNYYANSNYYDKADDNNNYGKAVRTANTQYEYMNSVNDKGGILNNEKEALNAKYNELVKSQKQS